MVPSRISAARRAGLHLWKGVGRDACMELPPEACLEEVGVSVGVNWLTMFSAQSPKVWLTPISSHTPSTAWRGLSLPTEEGTVQQVVSGLAHSLILSESGNVYSIGSEYLGQTGQSSGTGWTSLLRVHGLKSKVKQVACGLDHSLFLLHNGDVMGCGWAADGQTGTGSYESTNQLSKVNLDSEKAVFLASCSDSSFAVTQNGRVFGWGNHEYKQLGVDSASPQLADPRAVDCGSMDGRVTGIAAGGPFTAFLTCHGSVYIAGYRFDGSGGGDVLRQVHCGETASSGRVTRLKAGLNYLLALTSPSTGFLWGKCHLPSHSTVNRNYTPFSVSSEVMLLCCGPLGLAAIATSPNSKILELD